MCIRDRVEVEAELCGSAWMSELLSQPWAPSDADADAAALDDEAAEAAELEAAAEEVVETVLAETATEAATAAATASAAPLSADDAALSLRNVSLTLEEALEETAPAEPPPPAAEPPPAVEPPPVEPAAPTAAPRRSLLDSMGSTWRRLTKLIGWGPKPKPNLDGDVRVTRVDAATLLRPL